ncbi:hypothetical protein BC827DRAFT_1100871, partial [Russula dissimulans]
LLDSGATECFLCPETAVRLGVPIKPLRIIKQVKNVDSTANISGGIKSQAYLTISLEWKEKMLRFHLANIGEEEAILGYPFLEALDPTVDRLSTSI